MDLIDWIILNRKCRICSTAVKKAHSLVTHLESSLFLFIIGYIYVVFLSIKVASVMKWTNYFSCYLSCFQIRS